MPTFLTKMIRREPWQPPLYSAPLPMVEGGQLRPLGEVVDRRGRVRRWFTHPDGEMEADGETSISEFAENILAGPYLRAVDERGERVLIPLRVHRPGSFAAASNSKPMPARAVAVREPRPVDALAGLPALRALGRRQGEPVSEARGREAITARVARRYGVALIEVDGALVALGPRGVVPPMVRELLKRGRRLLMGEPCAWCGREATTTAEAFPEPVPWCGRWPDEAHKKETRHAA